MSAEPEPHGNLVFLAVLIAILANIVFDKDES